MTIEVHETGGITVTGEASMQIYKVIVLKQAVSLYAKTGMKAHRFLTPTMMLKLAGEYTGKTYKRGQYDLAIADLQQWLEAHRESQPQETL